MIAKIKYLLIFQFLFFADGEIYSQKSIRNNSSSWTIFHSPLKNNLDRIFMVSREKGFITGRYLLEFNGKEWGISSQSLLMQGINCFYMLDKSNYWAACSNVLNGSDFYYFDGTAWKAKYNPLANQISAIYFINKNEGFLAGDRELIFLRNNKREFLPLPNTPWGINNVFGSGKDNIWLSTIDHSLFHYKNNKWTQQLKGEEILFIDFSNHAMVYVMTNNKLYYYSDSRWHLHSTNSMFKNIERLFFLKDGEIWGVGVKGLIIHYNKKNWEQIYSPTKENLHDIFMLSSNEGWAIGDKGTILHYSLSMGNSSKINLGFEQVKITPFNKDVKDEYGISIEDFNNDGINDIYAVCIFDPNRLYIGIESETKQIHFEDEAAYRGATGITGDSSINAPTEIFLGAGTADIDNDSDEDIYLCNLGGKNKLLLNNGDGYFRNVTCQKGRACDSKERTNMAVFGDVDNDGDVDLFITNEYSSNRLYINNGNGYFEDVTESAGLATKYGGMCASFADIDGDGKLDLYVTNWGLPNILYKNISQNGVVKFQNITGISRTGGELYTKSNGAAFADVNNDGYLDLFVANRKTSNRLYLNNGKGIFTDVTREYLGIDSLLTYSATFADFDQDGFVDLYISNVGSNILYKNINGKKFVDITIQTGARLSGYGTGTSAGDVDNDGDMDLYAANYVNGSSKLYINNLNNNNFILLKINGTISNRDAIGAKVWLYKKGFAEKQEGLVGFREINGGSGYSSHNSMEVHFGADKNELYDIVIYFPVSHIKKTLRNIKPGQKIFLSEEDGIAAFRTQTLKFLKRSIIDPEIQFEGGKIAFILILILISSVYGKRRYNWNNMFSIFFHLSALAVYMVQIFLFNYKDTVQSTLIPASSILTYFLILYLFYERVIFVRIAKKEKQETRDRIARDLHDDLASTISSAVIYAETLKSKLNNQSSEEALLVNKVNSLLADATESITDIVWTVSPEHDKLSDLIFRLRMLISDICSVNSINFNSQINLNNFDYSIPDAVRRNIYLIFKESMNNIIRHSKAIHVNFKAEASDGYVLISLADDGIGFLPEKIITGDQSDGNSFHGHGIKNIIKRSNESGCELSINSKPGNGTEIRLKRKLT